MSTITDAFRRTFVADVLRAEQVFCVRYCALEYSQLFAHGTWAVCKQGEPILAAHLYQSLAKVGVINGVLLDENLDEVSTSADITDKHHVLFTWSAHGM